MDASTIYRQLILEHVPKLKGVPNGFCGVGARSVKRRAGAYIVEIILNRLSKHDGGILKKITTG
jgi:hypothetical protein